MGRTAQNKKTSVAVIRSKGKFRELIDRTLHDKAFRESLESDPQGTLATVGIDITDPATVEYLKRKLNATDGASLADSPTKTAVFAVLTSAGVVVAASTPAFSKGDGTAPRGEEKE